MEPKDFDVATDALPEDVKKLFRNCHLIGRRFRLAHVFFGRETIEVATFRAASAPSQGEEPLADADPEDGEAAELDRPDDIEAAIEAALDEDADSDEADDDADVDEDAASAGESAARRADPAAARTDTARPPSNATTGASADRALARTAEPEASPSRRDPRR